MKIKGIDGMSTSELNREISSGGKFVVYQYCISIGIMTFRRNSDIQFIKSGENGFTKGLGWTLLTFTLGWWGIPWGPIYTIGSLITNFGGGKDVTSEVLAATNAHSQAGMAVG
jgi:hypothetical protein